MLRAVIFDFDGVIADSEMIHFEAFNIALKKYGIEISKTQYYKDCLGLSDLDLVKDMHRTGKLKVDAKQIPVITEEKKHIFKRLSESHAAIIDGVPEFFELLNRNNITMAICSGALLVEIETILERANIPDYFVTIVSADQVSKSKPDPQGYILTLERLNRNLDSPIKPSECVVIEDSHWGIEAAVKAGMNTIAVTNSYAAHELESADAVVTHLSEITIRKLNELCS